MQQQIVVFGSLFLVIFAPLTAAVRCRDICLLRIPSERCRCNFQFFSQKRALPDHYKYKPLLDKWQSLLSVTKEETPDSRISLIDDGDETMDTEEKIALRNLLEAIIDAYHNKKDDTTWKGAAIAGAPSGYLS